MSSSPRDEGFAGFLGRSLAILREESPAVYGRMCAEMAPRELLLRVDREVVPLAFDRDAHRALALPSRPRVELVTTRGAILDLVDGRQTLLEALLVERIVLRGALDDVLAFHGGLTTYLHGAVRSFAMPDLLRSYRRQGTPSLLEQDHAHP